MDGSRIPQRRRIGQRPAQLLLAALAWGLAPAGQAQEAGDPPMRLGVVTHFSQGWPPSVAAAGGDLGVAAIRDGLRWEEIERRPGVFDFSDPRASFVEALGTDVPVTIVVNHPNPLYDGGATPFTDAGRAAFARFVVAVLDRFPNVTAIEVGNEFNSQDFVFGPIRDAPYEDRVSYYAALLQAVHDAVKARHPEVAVLGGAVHSIPVGYLGRLFALGALAYMDGLVIHPYTSPSEHVCRHIAILEQAMGADRVPVVATEFGLQSGDPAETAGYLLKMATALAACGVAEADWYALLEQRTFPGMGLIERNGSARPAGHAFHLARALLQEGNPVDVSPDPFTYAFRYGASALVLWGEPRRIDLAPAVTALDATGAPIATRPITLDPQRPVVLVGPAGIALGDDVVLADQDLVADSFHQFDWTNEGEAGDGFEGPWAYFALRGDGTLTPLQTRGGGAVQSEPWFPHLGHHWLRPLQVGAETLVPVDFADGDPTKRYAVVERYTSDAARTVNIQGTWQVSDRSDDGIVLRIERDGETLFEAATAGEQVVALPGVALAAGSPLDFIVGSRGNGRGDIVTRRIQIRAAD